MRARGQRIILKSAREVALMREASLHVGEILALLCDAVRPGITTWDLDQMARKEIARRKVKSAFLGFRGYPATICASVNDEVVHGVPRKDKVLKEGDIIAVDFGVVHNGYVGDSARTVAVGKISEAAQKLIDVTRDSLERAIAICTPEHRLSDIGRVVQDYAESNGFNIVRDFAGHGIGTQMHEDPQVLNYYDGPKPRLRAGLVIAIEPMVNAGGPGVQVLEDGWTAVTRDKAWSAHFEHSIAITEAEPIVLTRV